MGTLRRVTIALVAIFSLCSLANVQLAAQSVSNSNQSTTAEFDDPASVSVQNALAPIILDGKLDEAAWTGIPTLVYGKGASTKAGPGESTVTGGFDIKATYDYWDMGVFYGTFHLPNTDSSLAKVKFLRKGMNLYIGLQSDDKSICKFDWEGDGMFLKIKRANGTDAEFKLYYQNTGAAAETIRYEPPAVGYGDGAGFLPSGSTVNDTSDVDNGYSAELMIKLDSLGYTSVLDTVKVSLVLFDADGYQHPMNSYDTTAGSFYKTWWGSEWGGVYRSLLFTPEPVKFDDPAGVTVKNALQAVTLDGKLDESEWATAPTLAYGNGAFLKKGPGESTVTSGFDIKATYDYWDMGVFYGTFHLPNTDSSLAKVKFLRKGMNLYIGLQSDDKSICKFDWEGDGMFLKIKRANGTDAEFKLYYQNTGAAAETIRYEPPAVGYGDGAGFLPSGSTVNDTSDVDNGYSAELMIKLDSLGYTSVLDTVKVSLVLFDADGYQHPMNSYDTTAGSFYKTWWGSEWGGVYRSLLFTPEPVKFDDPAGVTVKNALQAVTLDGKLDESEWATAPTLAYGNGAFLKKGPGESTVTSGFDIKATYDYWDMGVFYGTFHLPNTDSSLAKVKFLRKGMNLYIGLQSDDKSICKFDWEGDGMFLKIKRANGTDAEFKLYYQNTGAAAETIRYEPPAVGYGDGAGFLPSGSTVNDTSDVDNGYSAELMIKLDSLGYTSVLDTVKVSLVLFDADGYQHPMNSYDTTAGSFYKTWWGSEWGGVYRSLLFTPEPVQFDDPDTLFAMVSPEPITLDGQLSEPAWANAATLAFGKGAFLKKGAGQSTVTSGFDIKATYDYWDMGVFYGTFHLPNTDSSLATVKFLRRGANLYVGLQSDDKSICKFDWEGDGMFLKIKRANGTDAEFKLYYQNTGAAAETIRYEPPAVGYGDGAGFLPSGSTVNDTSDVDNGYSAELMIRLDSLGYGLSAKGVQLSLVMFDADGYQHPMNSYDTTAGSFYKSWWGSEWGGVYRVVAFDNLTDVASGTTGQIPAEFALRQNYPNPFNPSTVIQFDVPGNSVVRITVYDVTGREVQTLVNGQYAPGTYKATLDGSRLSSGVYFYRMSAAGMEGGKAYMSTNKLILLK